MTIRKIHKLLKSNSNNIIMYLTVLSYFFSLYVDNRCNASHNNKWHKIREKVFAQLSRWSDKATEFNEKETRRSITVSVNFVLIFLHYFYLYLFCCILLHKFYDSCDPLRIVWLMKCKVWLSENFVFEFELRRKILPAD